MCLIKSKTPWPELISIPRRSIRNVIAIFVAEIFAHFIFYATMFFSSIDHLFQNVLNIVAKPVDEIPIRIQILTVFCEKCLIPGFQIDFKLCPGCCLPYIPNKFLKYLVPPTNNICIRLCLYKECKYTKQSCLVRSNI